MDNYQCIERAIELMVIKLESLDKNDIAKIKRSMEVNGVIKEFKISKDIKNKFIESEEYIYMPLLSAKSRYLKKSLGFDIYHIILDYVNSENRELINMVKNELFNLINYSKTTIRLIDTDLYYKVINIFNPIITKYRDTYRCTSKKYFTNEDLDFTIISNGIKKERTYKLMYIKPTLSTTNTNIANISLKVFGMPVIIDRNGYPCNSALWNLVYHFNSVYRTDLVVRCLVPFEVHVKNAIVYNEDTFLKKINKYFKKNIVKVPIEYSRKASILLLSTVDTALSKVR